MNRVNNTKTVPVSKLAIGYVFLIFITEFSLLYGWIPAFHSQAYIAVIAILLSVVIVPRFFTTVQFYLILCYAAVVWFNAKRGDPYTFDKEIMDGLLLAMSASISYYLLKSDDQRAKKWIFILISLILIIQTITSLAIYISSSNTIRAFMELSSKDQMNADWDFLYKMGIPAFDIIHALPLLVPPLIMWIQRGIKKWKSFCLISLICIVILIYIFDVTTVQILVIFCLIVSIAISPKNNKRNSQRVLILCLFFLPISLSTTIQDGLLSIVENVAEGSLKQKVASTRYDITHDTTTGDFANRQDSYTTSFETFLESPLIGKDTEEGIGGHSAIIDRLGAFGLLGFLPFILILYTTARLCFSYLRDEVKWYFLLSTISFIVLLISKNMCRLDEWLFFLVIVPSMLTLNMHRGSRHLKNSYKIDRKAKDRLLGL